MTASIFAMSSAVGCGSGFGSDAAFFGAGGGTGAATPSGATCQKRVGFRNAQPILQTFGASSAATSSTRTSPFGSWYQSLPKSSVFLHFGGGGRALYLTGPSPNQSATGQDASSITYFFPGFLKRWKPA